MGEYEALYDLYNSPFNRGHGHIQEYREYELRKVEVHGIGSMEHSEYAIYNRDGERVESYTIDAFESWDSFKTKLDKLIDYDPVDMHDWLNK